MKMKLLVHKEIDLIDWLIDLGQALYTVQSKVRYVRLRPYTITYAK
jgi:hypothetical protein